MQKSTGDGAQYLLQGSPMQSSSATQPPVLRAQPVGAGPGMMVPMPMAHAQPVGGPMNQQGGMGAFRPAYVPAPVAPGAAKPAPSAQEVRFNPRPTLACPVLCNAAGGGSFPLGGCRVQVDVHMASMFVNMVCSWNVEANMPTTGLFKLPTSHKATITNCAISIGTRLMRTAVIDSKDAGQYSGGGGGGGGGNGAAAAAQYPELASCSKFDPACFRMPIPNLRPGEMVEMAISYFEALDYVDGQYVVSVPLAFDGASLAGRRMESLVDIQCTINAGCPSCTLGECTFPYQRQPSANAGVVALSGDTTKPWMSNRFEVKYSVGAQDILTNCLNDSQSQCFSIVVAPPPADKVMAQYNKHVIFLIDRSGSMHGTPIANAKAALKEAVTSLNAGDFFNIVQFDHEQIFWAPAAPQPASTENKQNAHFWIDEIRARGTTDIMTPLQASITALENMPVNTDAGMCLPFVFLLTDGAVSNEREICQYLQQSRRRTRVMTLGIGEYCNYYFLQMMALMGHGFCELALQPDKIYQQINHLVQMANCPVLTDVSIDIEGVEECEIYPFPIPDLFLGAPIILSGKYQNAIFPAQVELSGTLATGAPYSVRTPVQPAGNVPVERVFLKQRLEILTSKGWLQDSPEIMGQVIALSTAASMPCAHTTMIAFETTPQQLAKFEKQQGGRAQNGELYEADSSGGAGMAGRRGLSNKAIGALAVGGTIMVVGASAASFGDIAATLGNVGAFAGGLGDSLGGLLGGGDIGGGDVGGDDCCSCGGDDDGGCCGCGGEGEGCDCDCGDCDCGDCSIM